MADCPGVQSEWDIARPTISGSGAQAIVSAVQSLMLGDAEMALAGGAECMSRSPYILSQGKLGISRTFPAGDNIAAACTISATEAASEVT